MTTNRITTVEQLQGYLHHALQLEHATIPPYLTALFSLHPGGNSEARHILRTVAVEEMLHLTLVANVLNAVGGSPDLTGPDFVPRYPTCLPDGEDDFEVGLQSFSPEALDTFLKIERPGEAPGDTPQVRRRTGGGHLLAAPDEPEMRYYSIGEFYLEIDRGLRHLDREYRKEGKELFTGDPVRQITPEYFYSGGGEAIPVTDLASALRALTLIAEQGEGLGGSIFDTESELSHYYRFQQLRLGQYYQKGDDPDRPSGPLLAVDFTAVYPVLKNARLEDYQPGSPLHEAAKEFNQSYAEFLSFLTRAYNGEPSALLEGVVRMFRIRDDILRLIRNPIPGRPGVHATPTFEPTD